MCLALPGQITAIDDSQALRTGTVEIGAMPIQVCLALVPDAGIKDYVLVHAGVAISQLDPDEAKRTLALFDDIESYLREEMASDDR